MYFTERGFDSLVYGPDSDQPGAWTVGVLGDPEVVAIAIYLYISIHILIYIIYASLACSNYIVYKDEDSLVNGKSGTLTVEFSEDVTSWTMEVTFDADVTGVTFYSVTNINCSGSTCTFDNEVYNGEQSAGNTLDIAFLYSFVDSTAVISDVSITSESTAFCSS